MEITRHDANDRSSRATVYNDTLYLGGHVAAPDKKGLKEQTAAVLVRLEELLVKFGSDKEHIVMTNIYLKDITAIDQMNEAWDQWIVPQKGPARCTVEAKLAEDYILIEVAMIAAIIK